MGQGGVRGNGAPAANVWDSASEADGKKKKVAKDARDPDWRWPTCEKWWSDMEGTYKIRDLEDENEEQEDGLKCPFKVTIRVENEDIKEEPDVYITLRSPYLIAILRKHLADSVKGLCCEEPEIDAKDVFIVWPALRQEYSSIAGGHRHGNGGAQVPPWPIGGDDSSTSTTDPTNGGDDVVATMHLHHLLRFMGERFKDVSAKLSWMKEKGVVSYDMLWAFLTPGVAVRWKCSVSGQDCYGVAMSRGIYEKNDYEPSENGFKMKLEVMDFNVDTYERHGMPYKLPVFDGDVPFTSLGVCPWSFYDTSEMRRMEERLTERGRKFYECAMREPFRFMEFHGIMGYYEENAMGCFGLKRVNGDGRVMVDLLSTARVNPDWPLGNAQPPTEVLRQGFVHDDSAANSKCPAAEHLKWAPAFVFGFSFSLKKWGCFEVDGLKEIRFNDEAYEQLVMRKRKQKNMLKAIVSTRLVSGGGDGWKTTKSVDVVAHKGEGCVVLCHGPPGTGKTLTAETLAETLHRPLWAISAFELGEEPGHLEKNLRQVLSTALRWRAVVLLDEADCYLERRSYDVDIKHNLMTGVFLRLLEYYGGVLFLTTNRVRAFDSAILSRISLCLHYPPLDDAQRRRVWRTLLERAGTTGSGPAGTATVSDADIEGFLGCGRPLNGREIRNVVVLAESWASSTSEPLHISHVHDALHLVLDGAQELMEEDGAELLREP